jgi:hypothetical protein
LIPLLLALGVWDTKLSSLDCLSLLTLSTIFSFISETILHLSEVVCATLKNPEFIDSIIPLISEKVMLLIKPKIAKIVDKWMLRRWR